MKNLFLFGIFLLLFNLSKAQDLIITTYNDTIQCKITGHSDKNIYFEYEHHQKTKKSVILKSKVINYTLNPLAKEAKISSIPEQKYKECRVAISGGFGTRIGKLSPQIPASLKSHYEDLKSGYQYEGTISFFFSEKVGAGLKINSFKSSGSTKYFNNTLTDEVNQSFIGPSIVSRFQNEYIGLILGYSIGYYTFRHKNVYKTSPGSFQNSYIETELSGQTVGFSFDAGLDFHLSSSVSLGINFAYLAGVLNEVESYTNNTRKVIELEDNDKESLNRFDVSFGVRFNL